MYQANLLTGKRVLITGGGTGLGKAMGRKFLSLGANLVICGRRGSILEETARSMKKEFGGNVETYVLDIRNPAAVEDVIDDIFKNGGLTDLVNNAAGNFISRTEDLSPRGFDAIANIVMHGTFYVTHAVGKRWVREAKSASWKSGMPMKSVISIIATWVKNGGPFVVPSTMSKAAVNGMTMSLAAEWGRYGIRLNTIGPGEIPTEGMNARLNPGEEPGQRTKQSNPQGRTGTMEELQSLATFLISGYCDWLSGEAIMMDGGGHLGTGGNFYELRKWDDAQWLQARESIEMQNSRDRKKRQ